MKWRLGYGNDIFVNRCGLSGGLALLWRDEIDVTLQSYSRRHIDVVINNGDTNNR